MSVCLSSQSVRIKKKKKKPQRSEERESQILTKQLVSFIIISPSTLSWFRHLNKIDDSRCFPLFHTFCALGSVSNMDLLYLFAIPLGRRLSPSRHALHFFPFVLDIWHLDHFWDKSAFPFMEKLRIKKKKTELIMKLLWYVLFGVSEGAPKSLQCH